MSTKTKIEQLEWRRSNVVEMRARGMTHGEIVRELQIPRASISSDIQYLRDQAKETIREYVTEHLPEQYQLCLIALDVYQALNMHRSIWYYVNKTIHSLQFYIYN